MPRLGRAQPFPPLIQSALAPKPGPPVVAQVISFAVGLLSVLQHMITSWLEEIA